MMEDEGQAEGESKNKTREEGWKGQGRAGRDERGVPTDVQLSVCKDSLSHSLKATYFNSQ